MAAAQSSSLGPYPTQCQVIQAPPTQQQPQQGTFVQVQRQNPQQQQVVVQQAQPTYSQQQQVAQPQTVLVHASPRQIIQEETSAARIRQFVSFKNLRHLNQPGQQWEYCEHITIALSPDELERKIRCHDIPGNDLVSCLSGMGVYRQRHLRRYEDKLNNRESDRANWTWVLEALGELRDKHKTTPHTFWAIFQRTSRRNSGQQSRQVGILPEVTLHHDPVQVIQAEPVPTIAAPPPPPALPAPQQLLALPAPQQPESMRSQYGPVARPAQSRNDTSPPTYHGNGSPSTYHDGASQYQTSHQTPVQYNNHNNNNNAQPTSYAQQQQQQRVQQQIPAHRDSPQYPPPTTTPRPTTVPRITQGTAAPSTRQYTRPVPRPIDPSTGLPTNPAGPFNTSNVDVHQYQVRDHSPPRSWREPLTPRTDRKRWFDDDNNFLSDDSSSSYDSSSGTSATDYCSSRRRRAPLGRGGPKSNGSSVRQRRRESSRSRGRYSDKELQQQRQQQQLHQQQHSSSQAPLGRGDRAYIASGHGEREHYYNPGAAAAPTAFPTAQPPPPSRVQQQNTYDIEVKFGAPDSRQPPASARQPFLDATPRTVRREEHELGYESEDSDEVLRKAHKGPVPVRLHNAYQASGMVQYGSDRDTRRKL